VHAVENHLASDLSHQVPMEIKGISQTPAPPPRFGGFVTDNNDTHQHYSSWTVEAVLRAPHRVTANHTGPGVWACMMTRVYKAHELVHVVAS